MKTILITGVSKGLGLEITKSLLSKNNKVYGISKNKTEEVNNLLLKYGDNFIFLPFDLSYPEKIKTEINDYFLKNKIKLDVLINNAAIAYDEIITNCDIEQIENMFKINVYSPMLLTKTIIRNFLLYKTSGSIINISSISAHTGYKGLSMYASTKGALESFSKNISREWGGKNIRSNNIVAGFMETNMTNTLSVEEKERIYKRTSLKRQTNIDSITSAINFLIDDSSNSITGQNIIIDSGTI